MIFGKDLCEIPHLYPENDQKSTFVLFLNGCFTSTHPLLQPTSQVILVDGGASHFLKLQGMPLPNPLCLIGDLDSISSEELTLLQEKYPDMPIYRCSKDKNYTDFEAALQLIKRESVDQIQVVAGIGHRLDQSLSNKLVAERAYYSSLISFLPIENKKEPLLEYPKEGEFSHQFFINGEADSKLLAHLAKHPFVLDVLTDYETVICLDSSQSLDCPTHVGQTISLIPFFGEVKGVQTKGLNWELNHQDLSKDFFSISNFATGTSVSVSLKSGKLLLIKNHFMV